MASDRIRLIHEVGPTLVKEVVRYRSTVTPANKNPRAFQRFARGISGHIPTNKIRTGDLLSLPAPSEQPQRAEPGGKERESGGERSGGWTCPPIECGVRFLLLLISICPQYSRSPGYCGCIINYRIKIVANLGYATAGICRKSKAGKRDIPLAPVVINALKGGPGPCSPKR